MAACSSCGATIRWARTSSGKAIPLDAEPDEGGNLLAVDREGVTLPADVARRVIGEGRGRVVVARRGHRSMDPELPHWRSHFATCPSAHRHRTARPIRRPVVDEEPQGRLL